MSEQIDIAVGLGAVPPPLPDIVSLRSLADAAPMPPPQVVEGVLHQGCKMVLSGTSKSNKSWCLLDLAVSVASGQTRWGRQCRKAAVLYINFELHDWAIAQHLIAICAARPECKGMGMGEIFSQLRVLRAGNRGESLGAPKTSPAAFLLTATFVQKVS